MKSSLLILFALNCSFSLEISAQDSKFPGWDVLKVEHPPASVISNQSRDTPNESTWILGNLWTQNFPSVTLEENNGISGPPFDLLERILAAYAIGELANISALYTEDSKLKISEMLSERDTMKYFVSYVSGIQKFEVVGYWICGIDRIVVYTRPNGESLLPYVASLKDGQWKLLAGEENIFFGSEVEFFANQGRMSELVIRRYTDFESIAATVPETLFSPEALQLFKKIKKLQR